MYFPLYISIFCANISSKEVCRVMKEQFNDWVVKKAAKISKKCVILTPIVYFFSFLLLGSFYLLRYFKRNGKRYITIGVCFVFFFMSSSFSFSVDSDDNEIYLSNTDAPLVGEITDINVSDEKKNLNSDDVQWIEDYDLYDDNTDSDLSSTENIDTFVLDDFLDMFDIGTATEITNATGFDKEAWNLILVNKTHPIPDGYEVPLATITGSMKCDERVLEPLTTMLSAASAEGVNLIVCSPYRDYELQTRLFNRKINYYMGLGYSYIDSYKMSSEKVIVPGASEHQIGMAFDIVTATHPTLDYEFGDTKAGKWLKENGADYGFILRYPRGKENITSIEYEPWHYRYVGIDAAKYIMENDLTLEEFIDGL